jgi:hypothetical protein
MTARSQKDFFVASNLIQLKLLYTFPNEQWFYIISPNSFAKANTHIVLFIAEESLNKKVKKFAKSRKSPPFSIVLIWVFSLSRLTN